MKSVLEILLISFVSGSTFFGAYGLNSDAETITLTNAVAASSVSALSTTGTSFPSSKDNTFGASLQTEVHVDKTSFLEYLLNEGSKLFFYSRPKSSGKSLVFKLLYSYFRGDKSYFEGTQLYERGNVLRGSNQTWTEYPIIYLDFSKITYQDFGTYNRKRKEFEKNLQAALKGIAEFYQISTAIPDFGVGVLIQELNRKFDLPVVILIDEYDSPIDTALQSDQKTKFIDSLIELLVKIIDKLLSQIRDNFKHLRFVWVTGEHKLHVSKTLTKRFVDVTHVQELETAISFLEDSKQ